MGQKLRVLVVDDSTFFCHRIRDILQTSSRLEVIGFAHNGEQAIEACLRLRPDVITMDVEMPVMDGISAVRRIMTSMPTRILMFSSLTNEGARETLNALEAGAIDFLPKNGGRSTGYFDQYGLETVLVEKVLGVARSSLPGAVRQRAVNSFVDSPAPSPRARMRIKPAVVAIGASTGGPLALQQVLSELPADYPYPLVLAVHMPGNFTPAYAERLNGLCRLQVREARDGDAVKPGTALLAPGGKQMSLEKRQGQIIVRVMEGVDDQTYRPSVDILLGSASRACPGEVLGIVLTGMGSDGLRGAQMLKNSGSAVWTQDEATSVVYGMPRAVDQAGLSDQSLPIDQIGGMLKRVAG